MAEPGPGHPEYEKALRETLPSKWPEMPEHALEEAERLRLLAATTRPLGVSEPPAPAPVPVPEPAPVAPAE